MNSAEQRLFEAFDKWMDSVLSVNKELEETDLSQINAIKSIVEMYKNHGLKEDMVRLYEIVIKLENQFGDEGLADEGIEIINKLKEFFPIVDVMSK